MEHTYQIIRSRRKTLSLEIRRDLQIILRAPLRCSDETIAAFFLAQRDWLQKHLPAMQAKVLAHPEPTEEEATLLRQRAKDDIPPCVEHFAALMGLSPVGITITGAKTRFGSCSGKNRLSFSWRLMEYPVEAIEYVVVHELAHIVHKNHGPNFYALIETVLPDWKTRRALLRQ